MHDRDDDNDGDAVDDDNDGYHHGHCNDEKDDGHVVCDMCDDGYAEGYDVDDVDPAGEYGHVWMV